MTALPHSTDSTPEDRPGEEGVPRDLAAADRPVALVVLGATGDLASRLLLPGLAAALAEGGLPRLTLVGSASSDHSRQEWQDIIREAFEGTDLPDGLRDELVETAVWHTTDVTDPDALRGLFDAVREAAGEDAVPVLYFALAPTVVRDAVEALGAIEDLPDGLRLAVEKPFGADADSAVELDEAILDVLDEDRVFRVDHFLGQSMVRALPAVRAAVGMLGGVWDARGVEAVDVLAEETLGLEGRAEYYDATGALQDMLQSHLLLTTAAVAMDPPAALRPVDVHDAMAAVLRATRVWDDDPVAHSHRARYTAGTAGDERLPDYTDEEGVDGDSSTETLAEVVLAVDTPRWAGVPFRLRSGKALAERRFEVVLTLRPAAALPDGVSAPEGRDRVRIGLDPAEVVLELAVDGSRTPASPERVALRADLAGAGRDPYGEVLRGILLGDPLLSVRGDMAAQCWRVLQPVIDAWEADRVPLEEYAAGSAGPEGWRRD